MDIQQIRSQFPVLSQEVEEGVPLCYLDSTATTQKPVAVLEAMESFYRSHYSSVKRGVYRLSEKTTQAYENARKLVQNFIGAESEDEVIFTRGTTTYRDMHRAGFKPI